MSVKIYKNNQWIETAGGEPAQYVKNITMNGNNLKFGMNDGFEIFYEPTFLTPEIAASTYLTIANAAATYLTIVDAQNTYLAKSGGQMTGPLGVSAGGSSIITNVNDDCIVITGGTEEFNGASLILNGKDNTVNAGGITLRATNGSRTALLSAKPDGTLKWNFQNVLIEKTSIPSLVIDNATNWSLTQREVYSIGGNMYFMSITVKNISGSAQGSVDYPVVKIQTGSARDCALSTACYEAPATVISAVIQTRSGGSDKVIKLRTNGAVIPNGAYIPISGVFYWVP